MPETSEGSAISGPKKWLGWMLLFVLALSGVWVGRALVLSAAVRASVKTVREIADGLPEPADGREPAEEGLLFPLWPIGPGADVSPEPEPATVPTAEEEGSPQAKKRSRGSRSFALGPAPQSARASVQQVLHWAEHQIVPRGITRAASDGMPAGIELHDVESLGLGLLPGDRLVTVDGVSVLERSQVVGAVLGARSRRAKTMTAGLVRRTKEGPVHFTVVVEQPYPEDVPDPG